VNHTTDTTPALELADLLDSLTAHLRANPNLSAVNISRNGYRGHLLQVSAYSHRGETRGANALHSWASSLGDVQIIATKWKHRDARIEVRGTTNDGHRLNIWDVVDGAASTLGLTNRDLPKYAELSITIEQLRALTTREEDDRG